MYQYPISTPSHMPRQQQQQNNVVVPQQQQQQQRSKQKRQQQKKQKKQKQQQKQQKEQQQQQQQKTYFCKLCNLTVESEIGWNAHNASHISCSKCDFRGSPRLVKAHIQSVHGKFAGSGFKTVSVMVPGCAIQRFRICVGDRPEDIDKWLAERKKNFPRHSAATATNKDESGTRNGTGKESSTKIGSVLEGQGSVSLTTCSKNGKATNDASVQDKNAIVCEPITESTQNAVTVRSHRPCRYFAKNGKCRNGDNCPYSHTVVAGKDPSKKLGKRKAGTSSSLLRKLLQTDADREATLTLQLLNYIVDCNYLQEKKQRIDEAVLSVDMVDKSTTVMDGTLSNNE